MISRDRERKLHESTAVNGIDFVEVVEGSQQRTLRVHFRNRVDLSAPPPAAAIEGGETVVGIGLQPIAAADWSADAEGRPLLDLHADRAGDFSTYTLRLQSPKLDAFYSQAGFSFKATCHSDLDCGPAGPDCPPEEPDRPPIDYLAKDFASFRKALSDFSALRYPGWQERSEADFGVMFMEALSAVADDLSYYQDRIAAEADLDTATERRSLVRLARLVDYEPRPATTASVLLQLTLSAPVGAIGPGLIVSAPAPDGGVIEFETGTSLTDTASYPVDVAWNLMQPYWWDDSQACLGAGSTEMWVLGHGLSLPVGLPLVIETPGPTPADPPVRELVHLAPSRPGLSDFAVEEEDPLFTDGSGNPTPVTHLRWKREEALARDHDLNAGTVVRGNVVPATQGRRHQESFAVGEPAPALAGVPSTLQRTGPRSPGAEPAVIQLYTLREAPLAWLASADDPEAAPVPEVLVEQLPSPPGYETRPWTWRRSLLDCDVFESAFTVDRAAYRTVARRPDRSPVLDYDGDRGETVRFGDGVFGEMPDEGSAFRVTYRVTAGAAGNVAADAITSVTQPPGMPAMQVTNPFPARGGADEEPAERVRRLAPEAFRARQYRAVLPQDYVAAARTLPWVQAAGCKFRWTGSWLTVFTTADPLGEEAIEPVELLQLIGLLNRYRMAGYEAYAPQPRFVALDLTVTLCALPDAFRADVEAGVLEALGTGKLEDGSPAFFAPNQFSFGTPLEPSRLEAAVQAVPGVSGVLSVYYRRRGVMPTEVQLTGPLQVGADQILRVDNDPSRPERGTLKVKVEGGK